MPKMICTMPTNKLKIKNSVTLAVFSKGLNQSGPQGNANPKASPKSKPATDAAAPQATIIQHTFLML